MEKRQPFFQQQTYHIYNRSNGADVLFRCDENYEFFLHKYRIYMSTWWDTQAWSLLPNEFHFIVTIHPSELNVNEHTRAISRAFADLCNGYVQAYNKHHRRKGSLLRRAYKRRMLFRTEQLRDLTCYIHNNPVNLQLASETESWAYSSYRELLFKTQEEYLKHPLLKLFASREEFVRAHRVQLGAGTLELPYVAA